MEIYEFEENLQNPIEDFVRCCFGHCLVFFSKKNGQTECRSSWETIIVGYQKKGQKGGREDHQPEINNNKQDHDVVKPA